METEKEKKNDQQIERDKTSDRHRLGCTKERRPRKRSQKDIQTYR